MEIYTLDSLLRRVEVVDNFESLIWTERFADVGDFDLKLTSTRANRQLFRTGTLLAVNTSYRVMTVESVESITDTDGRMLLNVKGRSLESTLQERVAKYTMGNLTVDAAWVVYDTPGAIARRVFDRICRDGALSLDDRIPFIMPGSIFQASTLPESSVPINMVIEPKLLYDVIKEICDTYDLGFRLVRNFDMSQLYFDIYAGSDRTTRQTTLPPVVFSIDHDNLQNSKELNTINGAKNVAYVFSGFGTAVVFAEDVPPDIDGFERRVIVVTATDIDANTTDVQARLIQQGTEALRKLRSFSGFDGEINQNSEYKYGVHYNLGDLVEMRSMDGVISYKRVTEQIFVHDVEGERSYPTLTMNMFVNANTWLSQLSDRIWTDFGLTEYWNTM